MTSVAYARVVASTVLEVTPSFDEGTDLKTIYHDDVLAALVEIPAGLAVAPGWTYDGTTFHAPTGAVPGEELMLYVELVKSRVLAQVFTFNVGTPSAPLTVSTRLDGPGDAAMLKISGWVARNPSTTTATLPYWNVDGSSAALTWAQANTLAGAAGDVDIAAFGVAIGACAAIAAGSLTTFAQVDALGWPSTNH